VRGRGGEIWGEAAGSGLGARGSGVQLWSDRTSGLSCRAS
jgi:hypothetical protein